MSNKTCAIKTLLIISILSNRKLHSKFLKKKNEISLLVGKKIRCLRQDRGLTMEQLAFEVGIEYTQLSRIERGVINTSIYQLFVISRVLQVEFAEIVSDLDLVDFKFE